MKAVDLIAAKRDGRELTGDEIRWLVGGFTNGEIPDYQVSAWLMATLIRGMSARETADLTMAMVASGRHLDLSPVAAFVGDKHSTGGVGDKTTLVVTPLVAAVGLPIGKMSGRGLGYSGGTIDKLESIPGFRTQLTVEEFMDGVRTVGLVVAAQTADLAPADGRLYALRDVTATVESIPLIASSIMSKKIAAGANAVVLDVKVGKGAFMKTMEDARALATAMRDIGRQVGLKVSAVLSGMDEPLGWAVGNALEVNEAVQTLKGEGPADLLEVAYTLGANLLLISGRVQSTEEGREQLQDALESGRGIAKLRDFVANQGGDPAFIEDPARLPQAPVQVELRAGRAGCIAAIDAEAVGKSSVDVGAGRATKGAAIDHSVGFVLHKKIGDEVAAGERLMTMFARSGQEAEALEGPLLAAYSFAENHVAPPPAVLEVIS